MAKKAKKKAKKKDKKKSGPAKKSETKRVVDSQILEYSTEEADLSSSAAGPMMPESSGADISVTDVLTAVGQSLTPDATKDHRQKRDNLIKQYICQMFEAHSVSAKYNVVILHDEGRMARSDIDRIYAAITTFKEKKPSYSYCIRPGGMLTLLIL